MTANLNLVYNRHNRESENAFFTSEWMKIFVNLMSLITEYMQLTHKVSNVQLKNDQRTCISIFQGLYVSQYLSLQWITVMINLEKVYLGLSFWKSQSTINLPCCSGPMVRRHITVEVCHRTKLYTSWPER